MEGPAYLSVLSYWEVMLKSAKGKLDVGDPRYWWQEAQRALRAQALSFTPDHIAALHGLPFHHNDPRWKVTPPIASASCSDRVH